MSFGFTLTALVGLVGFSTVFDLGLTPLVFGFSSGIFEGVPPIFPPVLTFLGFGDVAVAPFVLGPYKVFLAGVLLS